MTTWHDEVDAVWARADELGDQGVMDAMDTLAEHAPDPGLAAFERGGSRDSGGRPDEAEPLYRAALAAGLPDDERAQCTIQLASTLRNLGRAEESLALLRDAAPYPPYSAAFAAFESLTLASLGRSTEGLALVLNALAPTLPRYQRSVSAYAAALLTADPSA
jgi:tetratricopeptide (TPR) repeat protein